MTIHKSEGQALTNSITASDMAMTQLLISQRPSLQNIIVKGDLIVDESNRDSKPRRLMVCDTRGS
jgi:hypothetical protein